MSRHVHEMPCTRNRRAESIRFVKRNFRGRRGFPQMHPEMQCRGMPWVATQHTAQCGNRFGRFGIRFAIAHPVSPGTKIHQRFNKQGGCIQIVWIAFRQGAHCVGVGMVVAFAVRGVCRVALGQRFYVVALARADVARQSLRVFYELARQCFVVGVHGRIDVGAQHQRLTPIGHRTVRIQSRRLGEGAAGFHVIETVRQIHALIDEALRVRGGRYGKCVYAEVLQARREGAVGTGFVEAGGLCVMDMGCLLAFRCRRGRAIGG